MQVNDWFDLFGAILTIALFAMILGKANTASDINAAGNQFTGLIREAKA